MKYQLKNKLIKNSLLAQIVSHYTIRGAQVGLDLAQGHKHEAPSENQTHWQWFASPNC